MKGDNPAIRIYLKKRTGAAAKRYKKARATPVDCVSAADWQSAPDVPLPPDRGVNNPAAGCKTAPHYL
jgi:hypothetical protein